MSNLDTQAIQQALSGNWQEAINLNLEITELEPTNVDALNRLAYAYAQCGNFKKACDTYHTVLELDPYNPLAQKNLTKFKQFKSKPGTNHVSDSKTTLSPGLFLSDTEKTKVVNLLNIAPGDVLKSLSVGAEVFPVPKRFELQIKGQNETYLGTLPDDIGHPLLKILQKKNDTCRFFIKDVQSNKITLFIKYCT